uniref:Uncharacterized protein n=1 Tax=Onchocerca volvulus TaxID=6282 RepID=A0A8R1TSR1_ONCVO
MFDLELKYLVFDILRFDMKYFFFCVSPFITQNHPRNPYLDTYFSTVWKWQRLDSFEARRACSPEASKQAGNVVPGVGW